MLKDFFSCCLMLFLVLGCVAAECRPSHNPSRFVILICSYNNVKYVEENIQSALNQKYPFFRIIYVDDGSTDGTSEKLLNFLENHPKKEKVTVIRNEKNRGAPLPNHYETIHNRIEDDEVVVLLDGDDYLAHNHVLNCLDRVYSSKRDIWLTYGQFYFIHSQTIGWCCQYPRSVVESNGFREFVHMPSHLKTFYAWLFKKIRKEDLLYKGDFFKMTGDLAIMLPMIEMARNHHLFIPNILYLYNDGNELSEHQKSFQKQMELARYIRSLPKYDPLD